MIKKKQNIIVFCAHSDDQIIGPGATLAKYAKEGCNVYTVILSYGEASLPWLKKSIALRLRVNEAKKADRLINGKGVIFFGLKEGRFLEQADTITEKIKEFIKKKKPSKIFTHSPEDPHPDHKATCKIVLDCLEKTRCSSDVYAFDIWNPISINKTNFPKMYVDVTSTFPTKLKALKVFESQKIAVLSLFWSVCVRAYIHGSHIHKKYAERFFKLR